MLPNTPACDHIVMRIPSFTQIPVHSAPSGTTPTQHRPTPLTPSVINDVIASGRANPDGIWPIGRDIADARNKHLTNRLNELHDGVKGQYDWFEVDVRMLDGKPVAAHDAPDASALWMEDWIHIGSATGRGLKFDFKDRQAIAPTVEFITKHAIPQERMILNVPAGGVGGTPPEQLLALRTQFPQAIINLSPVGHVYSDAAITAAVTLAKHIGGPIMFPLDAERVTPSIITKFRRGGRVAIWNDPSRWVPRDIATATRVFREWGVDGMIDLRSQ